MTIAEEIQKLKQEKNAVILAHYYVNHIEINFGNGCEH